jgi:hypothetical protein
MVMALAHAWRLASTKHVQILRKCSGYFKKESYLLLVVQRRMLLAPDEKLVLYVYEGGDREDVFKMAVIIGGMIFCSTGMPSLFFKGKASQELKFIGSI